MTFNSYQNNQNRFVGPGFGRPGFGRPEPVDPHSVAQGLADRLARHSVLCRFWEG